MITKKQLKKELEYVKDELKTKNTEIIRRGDIINKLEKELETTRKEKVDLTSEIKRLKEMKYNV